jgi:nucleoside-triphosphatase THEP1
MMQKTLVDAEGDIAALVYGASDRPDLVLCSFARHLMDDGRKVCGLVQYQVRSPSGSVRKGLVLDGWQVVDLHGGTRPEADQCLDACWLDRMCVEVETAVAGGVDAVIITRFGPLEAAGRGFRNAILAASQRQVPLVVAVPDRELGRWTRFSCGMTVRLECSIDSVLAWWNKIASRGLHVDSRACELLK